MQRAPRLDTSAVKKKSARPPDFALSLFFWRPLKKKKKKKEWGPQFTDEAWHRARPRNSPAFAARRPDKINFFGVGGGGIVKAFPVTRVSALARPAVTSRRSTDLLVPVPDSTPGNSAAREKGVLFTSFFFAPMRGANQSCCPAGFGGAYTTG